MIEKRAGIRNFEFIERKANKNKVKFDKEKRRRIWR